jgi:site-specific DNA recombinase
MNDKVLSLNEISQKSLRCAIYTRVSTDHGLDQEFNSLDAQREACEAYIKSQMNEGWRLDATPYDDGGYSGGTTNRPALQKLLDAIRNKQIDIIVVYKVDRLTRSLADFAKLVELFDALNVSFVSVTQAFNTTNSMGRLTLNVLLSFAQFEREVTGERIRDKIAASKKKGIRMGGPVPLGYALKDKKIIPHETEAVTVREIFERYLALGSISLTVEDLSNRKIKTKLTTRKNGTTRGGIPFTKGPLAFLLRNRVYIGEIVHKGVHYPGEHEPIVPLQLFNDVQEKLSRQAGNGLRHRVNDDALLSGIIFDTNGNPMHASSVKKENVRYRYYQSSSQKYSNKENIKNIRRVPASYIEKLVLEFIEKNSFIEIEKIMRNDQEIKNIKFVISNNVNRINIHANFMEIYLKYSNPETPPNIYKKPISIPLLNRSRRQNQISIINAEHGKDHSNIRPETKARLIANVAKAHLWLDELITQKLNGTKSIAMREKISERTVRNIIDLAFLETAIVKTALN